MSQWGLKLLYGALEVIPLVKSKAFEQITEYSEIEDIYVLTDNRQSGDLKGNLGTALSIIEYEEVKAAYVGKPYGLWLLTEAGIRAAMVGKKLRSELFPPESLRDTFPEHTS